MLSASPQHALELLRSMLGSHVDFRPGQWDAIETVAIHKKRALVIQRTGWGKSLVYFVATKLLHEQGAGPTLLISSYFLLCGIKMKAKTASLPPKPNQPSLF